MNLTNDLHSCNIPHYCGQCIKKYNVCRNGNTCADFFPENMDVFLDHAVTYLKENTPLSKEKKLKRHARNHSSAGLKYDGTTTLDEYYVRMINDVLSEIRRGKTDYLFNFEQIRDVLRFERHIAVRYIDGCYEIKIEK